MNKVFSKTTGCFYLVDMQAAYTAAGTWPTDTVVVSDATFSAMMSRPQGKIIASDANGAPVIGDPVPPTIAQAQMLQSLIVAGACIKYITGGLPSSALGPVNTYPTTDVDQTNFLAAVTLSFIPGAGSTPIKCISPTGVKSRAVHTVAQTQKAAQDVFGLITAALAKKDAFFAQIVAATTVAAVQAIVWA